MFTPTALRRLWNKQATKLVALLFLGVLGLRMLLLQHYSDLLDCDSCLSLAAFTEELKLLLFIVITDLQSKFVFHQMIFISKKTRIKRVI